MMDLIKDITKIKETPDYFTRPLTLKEIEDITPNETWRTCHDGKCLCGLLWADGETCLGMVYNKLNIDKDDPEAFETSGHITLEEQQMRSKFIARSPTIVRQLVNGIKNLVEDINKNKSGYQVSYQGDREDAISVECLEILIRNNLGYDVYGEEHLQRGN